MATATAWIVQLAGGWPVALGEREMTHVVERPVLQDIPQTPGHCQQVLLWEEDMLPVLDLTAWLTGQPAARAGATVGIVGWQEQPEAPPQYGALLFTGIPQKVRVQDNQICDLPIQPAGWASVAVSCFHHNEQAVPILDVPALFSGALGEHHACRGAV